MMDEVRLQALRENHQNLRTKLLVVNILPKLRPYFTEVEYSQVQSKSDNIAQVDELFRILETKANKHFDGFCCVLEDNGYPHWAQQLQATARGNKEPEDLDREVMVEKECLYYVDIEELDDAFYGVLLRSIDKFVLESTDSSFQCFRREVERVIRHRGHVTHSKVRLSRVRTEFLDEIQDKYALWDNNLEYRPLREVIMRCEDEGLMKQLQQYEDLLRAKSRTIIYNCKKQKQMSSGLYMKLKAKHETTLATLMRVQKFLVKEVGLDDAIFTGFREGCIELYFKLSPEKASISMGPLLSDVSRSKLLRLGVSRVELSGHWVIDTASGRVTYSKSPQNECLTEDSDSDLSADEAPQQDSGRCKKVTQEVKIKQSLTSVPCPPCKQAKLNSKDKVLPSPAAPQEEVQCSPVKEPTRHVGRQPDKREHKATHGCGNLSARAAKKQKLPCLGRMTAVTTAILVVLLVLVGPLWFAGGPEEFGGYRTDLQGLNNAKVVSRQLRLGGARIISTIQATTSAGLTIEQGQAAYITEFEEVDIKCRWDPLVDSDSAYEIWLDDGARKRPLHKGNTSDRDVLTSSSYVHTLTTKNFRSGKYGCDIRSRNESTSSTDVIYLSSPPRVQLVDLKREKDIYPGPLRSANFFCDVQDDGALRTRLDKGDTLDMRTSSSHVHSLTTKTLNLGAYECVLQSRNEVMNNFVSFFILPKVDLKQGEDVVLGPSRWGNFFKTDGSSQWTNICRVIEYDLRSTSSTDAIYLFSSPRVQLVDLKREKDVYPGPSRSANFFCDVQDDTNQWTNICQVIEYRYRNGSDSSDKGTHSLSSAPGGDWQANGANLTIIKVEELAVNVIVWCRVNGLRVYMDSPSTLLNGNSSWSQPVIIDVAATTSPTGTPYPSCNASSPSPSHTPSPASSQSSVLGASIGSACVVIVALAALVVVVAIALIVVAVKRSLVVSVVKRENSSVARTVARMPCTTPSETEPEQGLPEYSIVRHPGNSQVSLTHLYLRHVPEDEHEGSLYRKLSEHL